MIYHDGPDNPTDPPTWVVVAVYAALLILVVGLSAVALLVAWERP